MAHGDVSPDQNGQCPTQPPTGQNPPRGFTTLTATATQGAATLNATVNIRVNRRNAVLCYTLNVTGLTSPVTLAHIHTTTAIPSLNAAAGDIVVPLTAPTTGTSQGCVSISRELAQMILQNVQANGTQFYVNVHTQAQPTGAIQATLQD